jgi:hypothetical protein
MSIAGIQFPDNQTSLTLKQRCFIQKPRFYCTKWCSYMRRVLLLCITPVSLGSSSRLSNNKQRQLVIINANKNEKVKNYVAW